MSGSDEPREERRWTALFHRGREPLFVLNRRRQIVFVNPAWETFTGIAAAEARGLMCTRRLTGHVLANLGRTLVPPAETFAGVAARARRPFPGTISGPPWWDIDFLPLAGDEGVVAVLGRIRRTETAPVAPRATMPAPWAELRRKSMQDYSFVAWESAHSEVRRAVAQARLAAESGCRAIIVGQPGVGKKTLARTIHANSPRRELPCITLDCASLNAAAIRAVLFGPLGVARPDWSGMLYLHEPAALPLDLQAELALAFGDRLQVLAGCAANPHDAVALGKLHPELYAALSVLVIELPGLANRRDDLMRFVDTFLERAAEATGQPRREVTPEARAVLQAYAWPGNLDELSSMLFALIRNGTATSIDAADLPLALRHHANAEAVVNPEPWPPLDELLAGLEKRMIGLALARAKGNKSKAAELLGVWRPRLLRRMEALGIVDPGGGL